MNAIGQLLRDMLRRTGYDVSRYPPASHALARRRRLLQHYAVDLVLDVGANIGQFALELRRHQHYAGRIVSFEPLQTAFALLQQASCDDPLWEVRNFGLAGKAGAGVINIAANSKSSSLLPMLPAHLTSAPESLYIGEENIRLLTLDSLFERTVGAARSVLLKIDTHGFERQTLEGARNSLCRIDTIQIEMSLRPLYAGAATFLEMHSMLCEQGFHMVGIEPGFENPETAEMLQVDGLFRRTLAGASKS